MANKRIDYIDGDKVGSRGYLVETLNTSSGRTTFEIATGDTTDVPCSEADGFREVELLDGSARVVHRLWVDGPLSRVERLVATLNKLATAEIARDVLGAEFSAARATGRRLDNRIREVYDYDKPKPSGRRS